MFGGAADVRLRQNVCLLSPQDKWAPRPQHTDTQPMYLDVPRCSQTSCGQSPWQAREMRSHSMINHLALRRVAWLPVAPWTTIPLLENIPFFKEKYWLMYSWLSKKKKKNNLTGRELIVFEIRRQLTRQTQKAHTKCKVEAICVISKVYLRHSTIVSDLNSLYSHFDIKITHQHNSACPPASMPSVMSGMTEQCFNQQLLDISVLL